MQKAKELSELAREYQEHKQKLLESQAKLADILDRAQKLAKSEDLEDVRKKLDSFNF